MKSYWNKRMVFEKRIIKSMNYNENMFLLNVFKEISKDKQK